jgi:superfamily II DNA/RNA helicase
MVLDEADKMLDLGFLADIEKLFAQTPAGRHTMLFSATMPGPIVALARRFMNRPIHIRATDPDEGLTQANIKHLIYRAHNMDKDEVIARILQAEGRGKTVVFTRTKRAAAKLVEELNDRGFNAAAVHGDLNQEQRERAMAAFKAGKKDILIATDVAARGIDVDDVTHVINHTIPDDDKTYLHRAGRTGRAGKTGIAVTFVDWDDLHKWALINRALEFGQPEPVETYSSSPHLFTDLDIPAGTRGRLKASTRSAEAGTGGGSGSGSGDRGGRGGSRGGERGGRDGGGRDGAGRGEARGGDSSRGESGGRGARGGSRGGRGGDSAGARSSGGDRAPRQGGDEAAASAPRSGGETSTPANTTTATAGTADSGEAARASRSRNRNRIRSGSLGGTTSSAPSDASSTESTSAGSGSEHHDGNSAPRRRSRTRNRAPRAE